MEKQMKQILVHVIQSGLVRLEQDHYPEDPVFIDISIE
jgi:hypothetical protein